MSDTPDGRGILRTMKDEIALHSGAYTRLALYMFLAFAQDILSRFGALSPEIVASMQWWDWLILYGSPLVTAGFVWRSFIDSSLADSQKNIVWEYDADVEEVKPEDPEQPNE